jgi:creatinine amidohydrolase
MATTEPVELKLERHTWLEVRDLIADGFTTVLIPCGAVEQHGPHLPLFVDAEHAEILAEQVAQRLGHALVAPTIRVGCSNHHMTFAGTVSVTRSTLQAILSDYVTSLARHGFTRILVLPAHGGNFSPIQEMLSPLRELVDPSVEIHAFVDLEGFLDVWRSTIERLAGRGSQVGGHADIAESSLMLLLHPALVRRNTAEPGYGGDLGLDQLKQIIDTGLSSVSANGILGDPTGMTPELGRACLDEMSTFAASCFESMLGSKGSE